MFNLAVARVIPDAGWEDNESLVRNVDRDSDLAFRAVYR
jgi:hypothetical protein